MVFNTVITLLPLVAGSVPVSELLTALGAIIAALADSGGIFNTANVYGYLAILLAAVNIFGGFLVTQRMLAMYKKKPKTDKEDKNA